MSLNIIFHIFDFHDLKDLNNIFFFIFEDGLKFLSKGVYHSILFLSRFLSMYLRTYIDILTFVYIYYL